MWIALVSLNFVKYHFNFQFASISLMLIFHNLPPSSINLPLLQDSNSRPLVYKSSALSVLPQPLSIRPGLNNLSELQRTVQRLDVIFLDKSCKFDNLISLPSQPTKILQLPNSPHNPRCIYYNYLLYKKCRTTITWCKLKVQLFGCKRDVV